MSSYVILLTDAHEAPAYELIEALRAAGVKTLIEGLREVEVEAVLAEQRKNQNESSVPGPPPLAVLDAAWSPIAPPEPPAPAC